MFCVNPKAFNLYGYGNFLAVLKEIRYRIKNYVKLHKNIVKLHFCSFRRFTKQKKKEEIEQYI